MRGVKMRDRCRQRILQFNSALAPGIARRRFLLLTVLVAVLFHLAWALSEDSPSIWGDEVLYQRLAESDLADGRVWPIPGTLTFEPRPQLGSRLLATSAFLTGSSSILRAGVLLNLVLMALLIVFTHEAGLRCGFDPPAADLAAGLLAVVPALGFHVHSLWPEILHAFLLSLVFLGVAVYFERWKMRYLVLAGLASGFALLTKGVLGQFLPIAIALIALATWRNGRSRWRCLLAPTLFAVSVALVVLPQLLTNLEQGHGARLSANRWWNLELGLVLPVEDHFDGEARRELTQKYKDAAGRPADREVASRVRVEQHLLDRKGPIVVDQVRKLSRLVVMRPTSLEVSVTERLRWGPDPPVWLSWYAFFSRIVWIALWGLGLMGMARYAGTSWSRAFLGAFGVYFLVSLLAVPVKPRFALPVVPVFCLFSGVLVQQLLFRRGGRRSPV